MAIISGVTVDFAVSPRIITIPDPIVLATVQDIYDTLRDIEDEPRFIQYDSLVSGGGKEQLRAGALVGITMTLQNAKIAFEDRGGPSFIQCIISGGNTVAVDGNQAVIDPIEPSDFTQVVIEQSTSPTLVDAGVAGTIIEGTLTLQDALKILVAVAAGKSTIVDQGGGLADVTFRDTDDSRNRVVANMTDSERTTVTLDLG